MTVVKSWDDFFTQLRGIRADHEAEIARLRSAVLREWAIAHHHECGCDEPDSGRCAHPVPTTHTMDELDEAVTTYYARNASRNAP